MISKLLIPILLFPLILILVPSNQLFADNGEPVCYCKKHEADNKWHCSIDGVSPSAFENKTECQEKCLCPKVGHWTCGQTGESYDSQSECSQNCTGEGCYQGGPYLQCIIGWKCPSNQRAYSDGEKCENACDEACQGPGPVCVKPGLVPCGNYGQPDCGICDFFVLAQNIILFILIDIIPPLAALMVAIAGLMLLFTGGNPQRRARARKLLRNIVIGIILAYISFLIINSILAFIAPGAEEYFSLTQGGFRIECRTPPDTHED